MTKRAGIAACFVTLVTKRAATALISARNSGKLNLRLYQCNFQFKSHSHAHAHMHARTHIHTHARTRTHALTHTLRKREHAARTWNREHANLVFSEIVLI